MLGWGFDIYRQKHSGDQPAELEAEKGQHIASWNARMGGLDWLEELVQRKKAICRVPAWYPGFYTARMREVLPVLQGQPPEVVMIAYRDYDKFDPHPEFDKSDKVIAACSPDEWLIIYVWDLS